MTAGVVLATYGSPPSLDEIGPYLEHIIGRTPSDEQVARLRAQYEAAGGVDLLPEMTRRQVEALQERFDADVRVVAGYKHADPFLEDIVEDLAGDIDRGVVVPLAPHDNSMSVAGYHRAARTGLDRVKDAPPFAFVRSYHTHPRFVEAWADRVRTGLQDVDASTPAVLFTAHSLPSRILDEGDPYPEQVETSCALVADAADADRWDHVYQSAPPHGDWLGPDVGDAIAELADRDVDGVVVAPIGFASDHMETRYDLDVEAREAADEVGIAFERVPALNDDERYIGVLEDVASAELDELG